MKPPGPDAEQSFPADPDLTGPAVREDLKEEVKAWDKRRKFELCVARWSIVLATASAFAWLLWSVWTSFKPPTG